LALQLSERKYVGFQYVSLQVYEYCYSQAQPLLHGSVVGWDTDT
jgi:hypothetical protein